MKDPPLRTRRSGHRLLCIGLTCLICSAVATVFFASQQLRKRYTAAAAAVDAVALAAAEVEGTREGKEKNHLLRARVDARGNRGRRGGAMKKNVAVVTVSDKEHQEKYLLQQATMRSYALENGYDYRLIDPAADAPECGKSGAHFFFQKHWYVLVALSRSLFPLEGNSHFATYSAVASWLANKPKGYAALVLDGDCYMASKVSLDRWLAGASDADIILYERAWNFEVVAGNYIVRNTEFARAFLKSWARFSSRLPVGFSSMDNGAIHLALLEVIDGVGNAPSGSALEALRKANQRCNTLYSNLTDSSSDLRAYFRFVECTRRALGPARRWTLDGGSITVLNRYHGFVIDGVSLMCCRMEVRTVQVL